jgi:hypothetical protein
VLATFATQWLYWTISEVLLRGQTLGKRALRIRVVRQDGSPVTFFESAVRNLCRAVDFLPGFYVTGIVCMLFTQRHLRLGDLLAGTVVIREEKIDLSRYGAASEADDSLTPLDTNQTELVLQFLSRAPSLESEARLKLGQQLAGRILGPTQIASLKSVDEVETKLRSLVQRSEA